MRCAFVTLAIALAAVGAAPGAVATAPDERGYIVTFNRSAEAPASETEARERRQGFEADHVYRRALEGFAADLSPRQVARLEADPEVASITPDRPVEALAQPLAPGEETPPPGLRRVGAATTTSVNGPSGADVAVLDTGIDLDHPDLNAVPARNCDDPEEPPDDVFGHGTHVAGTIAAENDGAGVTGVAPGTRVHSVKVLSDRGGGTNSSVICGIDWVTSTRTDSDPSNDIEVANMSLGGSSSDARPCGADSEPQHRAVCASVAAGVTYIAAAGNRGAAFDAAEAPRAPAVYPEALTVTAMGDTDGAPGARGAAPAVDCGKGQADDRYAAFSNYASTVAGDQHTVAGPGVCVRSTLPDGEYGPMSGTSMATPHLAGAVALCLDAGGAAGPCAGLSPAAIVGKVRNDALNHLAAQPGYGFRGDPTAPLSGRGYGFLAWTGTPDPDTVAPAVVATSPSTAQAGVDLRAAVEITFNEPMDEAATAAAFSLTRTSSGASVAGDATWRGGTLVFRPDAPLAAGATYAVRVSTGARDLAGRRLAAAERSTFRTLETVSARPSAVVIARGAVAEGGAGRLGADDDVFMSVDAVRGERSLVSWSGRIPRVSRSLRSLRILHRRAASRTCAQTISVLRPATGAWETIDAATVGVRERLVDRAVAGSPPAYVDGDGPTGEVRVRVSCARTGAPFRLSSDLLRVVYTRP